MCYRYKTRVRVRELGFKEDRTLSLKLCFTSPHWLNGSITTRNVYCLCCCCVSFAIYSYWVVCWISKHYYIQVWLKSQALQSDFNVSWQFCAVWWGQDHSSLTNISSCSDIVNHFTISGNLLNLTFLTATCHVLLSDELKPETITGKYQLLNVWRKTLKVMREHVLKSNIVGQMMN